MLSEHPIFVVMAIATMAPLLAEIPIGVRVPVVVLEVVLGVIIGPSVLGLIAAEPGGFLHKMIQAGMSAVLFMAGMEIDFERIRGRPSWLGMGGWIVSVALAFTVVALLHIVPDIHAPMMVTLALSTTALAVLLPILRDSGQLEQPFGRLLLAAGTIGEVAPILVVALLLSQRYSTWQEFAMLTAFLLLVVLAATVGLGVRPPKVIALLERTLHAATQLPVRFAMLLLASAYLLADLLGLEGILGAFAMGMVIGLATRGPDGEAFRAKIDAVCFGWLIPFFFVGTGINFVLGSLWQTATTAVLVPLFVLLFVAVRGTPVLLFRKELQRQERLPFAFYSAVPSLALVIIITEIGRHAKSMSPEIAHALIGAALISTLLFPTFATLLLSRVPKRGSVPASQS